MFCPKCGTQLPDGAAFCKQCGARLSRPAQQGNAPATEQQPGRNQTPVVPVEPTPAPVAEPVAPPAEPPVAVAPPQPPRKEKKKGGAGKIILIVALIVVVLAAAGFCLYHFGVLEQLGLIDGPAAGDSADEDEESGKRKDDTDEAAALTELSFAVEEVDLSGLPLVSVSLSFDGAAEDIEELPVTVLENDTELEAELSKVKDGSALVTYESPLTSTQADRDIQLVFDGEPVLAKAFALAGEPGEPVAMNLLWIDNSGAAPKLYCTLTDESGATPANLTAADFTLTLDGAEVAITGAQRQEGFDLCLLLDKSGSVDSAEMEAQREVAAAFAASVATDPNSTLQLMAYDSTVQLLTPFTADTDRAVDAAQTLEGYGASAFYDALMVAIESTAARDGVGVVFAVTDGADTVSTHTLQEAADYAARCGVALLLVGVGDADQTALETIGQSAVLSDYTYVNRFSDLKTMVVSFEPPTIYALDCEAARLGASTDVELNLLGGGYEGDCGLEVPVLGAPTRTGITVYEPTALYADIDMDVVREYIAANAKAGTQYSFFVKDLTSGVEFGTDTSRTGMSASALINVPILFTLSEQIRNGDASLDDTTVFHYTYAGRGNLPKSSDGQTMTIASLVENMLTYSDNNATNSLIEYLGLETINEVCHTYGFLSVDMQRLLVSGSPRDPDNFVSTSDLVGMLELLCSDWSGLGAYYLYDHFMIEDSNKAIGVGKYLDSSAVFLNHNALTPEKYNEVALIIDGSQIYIIAIMSDYGAYAGSAEAAANIADYVHDCLIG